MAVAIGGLATVGLLGILYYAVRRGQNRGEPWSSSDKLAQVGAILGGGLVATIALVIAGLSANNLAVVVILFVLGASYTLLWAGGRAGPDRLAIGLLLLAAGIVASIGPPLI